MLYTGVIAGVLATGVLYLRGADDASIREAHLWRHRTLGKAYFEDPVQRQKSAGELRKALDLAPGSARDLLNYGIALLEANQLAEAVEQLEAAKKADPTIPHIWFNLGMAYRRLHRFPEAVQQLRQMVRMVPDEPVAHHLLAGLYALTEDDKAAERHYLEAARLDSKLVGPHFQLFNLYRRTARDQDAARELALFRRLKKEQADAGETEDLEWCYYAELYDPILGRKARPAANPRVELQFETEVLADSKDFDTRGLGLIDVDGRQGTDLLAWSESGLRLYRNGLQLARAIGLDSIREVEWVAPGDFDNDGAVDLCVLTSRGIKLMRNRQGRFEEYPDDGLPAGIRDRRFTRGLWIDYDHDNDLDLMLFGVSSGLLRNQGVAGFTDQSAAFPFAEGTPVDAVALRLVPDTKGFDIVASYSDHEGVLYRDLLRGRYEAIPLRAVSRNASSMQVVDFDHDSWMDLAFVDGKGAVIVRNHSGTLRVARTVPGWVRGITFADLDGKGTFDLVSAKGAMTNEALLGRAGNVQRPWSVAATSVWTNADFDGDGRVDLAFASQKGTILLRNRTEFSSRWLAVHLTGVRNPKIAAGSEVEIRAGAQYQKKTYWGVPLWFGLGNAASADSVRIIWPNGQMQNVIDPAPDQTSAILEAPRMSGSCPMIFTWNGQRFEFVTDVLGVAPLGASSGGATHFPLDHDEYVSIPGQMLKARDGQFQVRITEELQEISYLDLVKLIAVDHPADVEVLTNDKFQGPPFPKLRLFGVRRRIYPRKAVDHRGADILAKLVARDRVYPSGFQRNHSGKAEFHTLDLDFGREVAKSGRAVLVLHGWVDWADGSTFLSAAQERPGGLRMPQLQVRDQHGNWTTVVDDMGIPAGKPKTIVVDLSGKFLSESREVRIATDICVYWDDIYLSEETDWPTSRLTSILAEKADLRFRGFSTPRIHPERKQPETFDYDRLLRTAPWNPTSGLYTRFGDVSDLLDKVDDRFAIVGSGDEIALAFPARDLPSLPAGWKRDFLLLVDGWAKDSDANTAFSQSVDPLPFHGMSGYPYGSSEHFPSDETRNRYRHGYNTRPAVRLVDTLTRSRR